jgi:hypothetical protein
VAATFAGVGVGEYRPGVGWSLLTAASATQLALDAVGDVFGAFAGNGVWKYDPVTGWHQLTATDATALAAR